MTNEHEASFNAVSAPSREGVFVLEWEGEHIVGSMQYIFDHIENLALYVHSYFVENCGSTIELQIHDYDNLWQAEAHKIDSMEGK